MGIDIRTASRAELMSEKVRLSERRNYLVKKCSEIDKLIEESQSCYNRAIKEREIFEKAQESIACEFEQLCVSSEPNLLVFNVVLLEVKNVLNGKENDEIQSTLEKIIMTLRKKVEECDDKKVNYKEEIEYVDELQNQINQRLSVLEGK